MFVVMTVNTANGLARPAELVPVLAASGADVIGFQEVSPDQGEALESALRELYPHRAIFPLGYAGKAILSKFRLLDVALLELHPGRPDLSAVLDLPVHHQSLRIMVAHPPPPRFRHGLSQDAATRTQVARLIDLATSGGPAVLLGDFNAIALQKTYRDLAAAGLIDAFRTAGRGRGSTVPTRLAHLAYGDNPLGNLPIRPLLRVDYIWHTAELRTIAATIGAPTGSDHLPVLATLEPAPTTGVDPQTDCREST